MSQIPKGWSVEVKASQVVVWAACPWGTHGEYLSPEEAWELANELAVGYLAISGALGVNEPDAVRSALGEYSRRGAPELSIDADAQDVYDAVRECVRDAGYPQPAAEAVDESVKDLGARGCGASLSADEVYHVRDYRDDKIGRPRIEAWPADSDWSVARAVEHAGAWLVMVDPEVAELVGSAGVHLTALEAVNADEALEWVRLLAALYVKAAAK